MVKIMTNDVVYQAVEPYLTHSTINRIIPLGHDCRFFHLKRKGGLASRPLKVAYTTWKSNIGDQVSRLLENDRSFIFRSIRKAATHEELRKLYHWSDAFLATPLAEEGFYMPALEAMASGTIVVTPDAGGNMAYCKFDENCIEVGLEDVYSYAAILRDIPSYSVEKTESLRAGGYAATEKHTLEAEREGFAQLMEELEVILGR
jgi:glycosyltransferase involved in cell wall biosynthesis